MQVGYTGKLPAYGDFLQGGGALQACSAWSAWAESGMASARDRTGFSDIFLTSPIWRFAVADNVFASQPVAGVFCPSMDKVGRLFPFAVLTGLAPGVTPMAAFAALGGWFDQVEAAVLAALDPEATVEKLTGALRDPMPMQAAGAAAPVSGESAFFPLDVTIEGEPVAGGGDPLDLSDDPVDTGDGVWITLGGIDANAHGVRQQGAASDLLFARLVTGGEAHGV